MKRLFKFLTIFLSIVFCSTAFATDVTLQWTPNTETDLAGYRLFLKKVPGDYDFSTPTWEGTETTCKITNLSDEADYFFVLRAFDVWGLESGNSNEVRLYRGQTNDGVPPANPQLKSITIVVGQ